MRVLGANLTRETPASLPAEHTLVQLDQDGRVARSERVGTLPEVAAMAGAMAGGEAFLLESV